MTKKQSLRPIIKKNFEKKICRGGDDSQGGRGGGRGKNDATNVTKENNKKFGVEGS